MKIQTSRFGEVDVPEESIVMFPLGLVGLPRHTRYVVFDVEHNAGYQWLQSLDDPTLAFVIVQADLIQPDFQAQVAEESLADLDVAPDESLAIKVIVSIPQGRPDQATANLRAPIVVNLRTRKAKQIILHESLPLRVPLAESEPVEREHMDVCLQGAIQS